MRTDNADTLGAIHRASAAHADNDVTCLAAIDLSALHDLICTRIGSDTAEHMIGQFDLFQAVLNVIQPAGCDNPRIGYDQHFVRHETPGVNSGQFSGAATENNLRGYEFSEVR